MFLSVFVLWQKELNIIQKASKVEQTEVLDVVRNSEQYKSESSYFGDRHLHDKDKKAIMGSEWLGSVAKSFSKGNSMATSSGKPNAFSVSSNNSPREADRFSKMTNFVHTNKN